MTIKRNLKILVLIILIVFSVVSCRNIIDNTIVDKTTNNIAEELNGFWGKSNELYTSFDFAYFNVGKIQFGTYCGYTGMEGVIKKIKPQENGVYEINIVYPAYYDDYNDENVPEETEILTLRYDEKTITFNPDSEDSVTYEYMGVDLDAAVYMYENVWDNVPFVDKTVDKLNNTLTGLKRKMGSYLSGPYDSWKNNAVANFNLYNLNGIDCYFNVESRNEIIGFRNEEIIFRGIYGLSGYSMKIKDVVDSIFWTVNPKICNIPSSPNKVSFSMYIWKVENGYVCITATNFTNTEFYNQYVSNVIFIKDLKYLTYYN